MSNTVKQENWVTIFISTLYIFLCLNDTYAVEIFGEGILKNTLLVFAILNIRRLLGFFSGGGLNTVFGGLLATMVLSFIANWTRLESQQSASYLIIAVIFLFGTFSQTTKPTYYLKVYVAATICSSLLCITSTTTISEYTFRRTGGMGDPNEFSLTVLCGIGIILAQILFHSRDSIKKRIGMLFLLVIYLLGLLYAGSKSALIVSVALLLFAVYHIMHGKSLGKKIQTLTLLFFGVGGILYFLFKYNAEVVGAFTNRFEDSYTGYERLLSWEAGLSLFTENPILGVGPDNYGNMVAQTAPILDEGSRAAHNMYVQALVELGVLGFIPYVILLFKPLYRNFKNGVDPRFLYPLIAILFMGASLSLLYEKSIWIIIALVYNCLERQKHAYVRK